MARTVEPVVALRRFAREGQCRLVVTQLAQVVGIVVDRTQGVGMQRAGQFPRQQVAALLGQQAFGQPADRPRCYFEPNTASSSAVSPAVWNLTNLPSR